MIDVCHLVLQKDCARFVAFVVCITYEDRWVRHADGFSL